MLPTNSTNSSRGQTCGAFQRDAAHVLRLLAAKFVLCLTEYYASGLPDLIVREQKKKTTN